ncbi:GNAT family N-acetyltransferase [Cohnella thailandensis]|uniref:GNAT family N-acetyltransferase n=1 Tax=Cohnella thailandensis TaxID=557557 RepID=UPI001DF9FF5A|nr:GNAT family N-acetyltransferase [Cohnella thailandensis]MBP1972190.1 putative GNAT family acetyltransferase [Cohnella thailandensis]
MSEYQQSANGFYLGDNPDDRDAEIEFSRRSDGTIVILHTLVSDRLRGQGIGQELVRKVVELAREEGVRIVPLCPFAKAQFQRVEQYQDVWAR